LQADDYLQASTAGASRDGEAAGAGTRKDESKGSVTLDRVKVSSKLLEFDTKLSELGKELDDREAEIVKDSEKLMGKSEAIDRQIGDLRSDLAQAKSAAKLHVKRLADESADIAAAIATCTTREEVATKRGEYTLLVKKIHKEAVKIFRGKASAFDKLIVMIDRGTKMKGNAAADVSATLAVPPPLHACLYVVGESAAEPSASLFEAKGGLRGALVAPSGGKDPSDDLRRNAYVKKGIKDLDAHMAAHNHWGFGTSPSCRRSGK
jgi:hypothetical protein